MFNQGDVVVALDEFVEKEKGETLEDTLGLVLDYNPENDYLLLGSLHPEKYAIPPTFSMRGEYYRHITSEEKIAWNIIG